ncbi:MAG: tryptophan synthase subunit alpha, partial [Terriglobales bacterium]
MKMKHPGKTMFSSTDADKQRGTVRPSDPPMSRCSDVPMSRLSFPHRPGLVVYVTCGDPDIATTRAIILSAILAGADVIELGVPFSDPLADGATIQHAGHVALDRGMTVNGCMEIAR